MHMREEGQQAQHGDDLELQLLRLVCYALGKGMQPQEETPTASTATTKNTAMTTMRRSISPGAIPTLLLKTSRPKASYHHDPGATGNSWVCT
jgi:hypothetical protein